MESNLKQPLPEPESMTDAEVLEYARKNGDKKAIQQLLLRTPEDFHAALISYLKSIDFSKDPDPLKDTRLKGCNMVEAANAEIPEEETLLGNRWLCRGAGAFYIGPSGIGKSSSSIQQDALWSVGQEAFGIKPPKPLRILTVQSENDPGDLKEMTKGVIDNLDLTPAQMKLLADNTRIVTVNWAAGGQFFLDALVPALDDFGADILRIDPYNGFTGFDAKDTEKTSWFLRAMLNPILTKFNIGCILNHHTPKTQFQDKDTWNPGDYMYGGAGCAEMTNWARAVLLISHTNDRQMFRFIGAKRGARIGWKDAVNKVLFDKHYIHSNKRTGDEDGSGMFWLEASQSEVKSAGKKQKTLTDYQKALAVVHHLNRKGLTNKERGRLANIKWLMSKFGGKDRTATGIILTADKFGWIENTAGTKVGVEACYMVTTEGLNALQDNLAKLPPDALEESPDAPKETVLDKTKRRL